MTRSVVTIRKLVICFFLENHSAPPDVTTYTSEHPIQVERPQGSTTSRTAPKYGNAELMETGDGRSPGGRGASFLNPVPALAVRAADSDLCRGSHGGWQGVSGAVSPRWPRVCLRREKCRCGRRKFSLGREQAFCMFSCACRSITDVGSGVWKRRGGLQPESGVRWAGQ